MLSFLVINVTTRQHKRAIDQCIYKTTHKATLTRHKKRKHIQHIKYQHENVKFPCDQCDYKAKDKGYLLKHIKSRHEGVKYPCDQCAYKATFKGALRRHIKLKHLYYLPSDQKKTKKKEYSVILEGSVQTSCSADDNCQALVPIP